MARKHTTSPLKHKRRIIKIVARSVVGVIIAVLIVGLFRWSRLSVGYFVFEGNTLVDTNDLAESVESVLDGEAFGIFPNNNILRISKNDITSSLMTSYPDIQSIAIDKVLPSTLRFIVAEREKRAVLCEAERCAFVDENGVIFKIAPQFSEGVYLEFENHQLGTSTRVWIGDNIFEYDEFTRVVDFADKTNAVRVLLLPEGGYEFYTKDGWYIKLASRNDFTEAFSNLKTFLEHDDAKNLQYVDLRFGNKVFYK